MSDPTSERDPIEALADSFLARYRAGERPSVEEYAERHPELAEEIRGLLPALVVLERDLSVTGDVTGPAPPARLDGSPKHLGDYLIVREIGRGGMGVVYEAVQQSLGRHVALKVLPWQSLGGSAQLERFRLEARSAARLHHSNIVPVFGVGEHEGTHYYAMQFIRGQGLDAIVEELRRLRDGQAVERPATSPGAGLLPAATQAARSRVEALATGRLAGPTPESPVGLPTTDARSASAPEADGSMAGVAGASASSSSSHSVIASTSDVAGSPEHRYFLGVARIGLQVAEALDYAHAQGILHRDIKPSNLLMDGRGNVWVTDFGLAKAEGSEGPTQTGDIVGTLRYMAPERFEGWSDRRSDVYALGATLYELATLRPLFDEPNRAKLIERVLHDEPIPPRRLDPGIPRDLETIILKATAREPGARYADAGKLADDLRRFLHDEPIAARRVTPTERLTRWARRNRGLAASLAALGVLLATAAVVGSTQAVRFRALADRNDRLARAETAAARRAKLAADRANLAAASARAAEMKLAGALRDLGRQSSLLAEEKGLGLIGQKQAAPGALWLARSLEMLPTDEAAAGHRLRTALGSLPIARLRSTVPLAPARCWSISDDGRWCLAVREVPAGPGPAQREFRVVSTATGAPIGPPITVARPNESTYTPSHAVLGPDGRRLVVRGADGPAGEPIVYRLHDTATGQPIGEPIAFPGTRFAIPHFTRNGRAVQILLTVPSRIMSFDPDTGRSLGAAWALPSTRSLPVQTLRRVDSLDGTFLDASQLEDGRLEVWAADSVTGQRLRTLWSFRPAHDQVVMMPQSPDGRMVAIVSTPDRASGQNVLEFREAATGAPVGTQRPLGGVLRSQFSPVLRSQFSPDGRLLLVDALEPTDSGERRTVRVFEVASGREVVSTWETVAPSSTTSPAFRGDSRTVVTSTDDAIQTWELPDALPPSRRTILPEAAAGVAWADGGKTLVTLSVAMRGQASRIMRAEELGGTCEVRRWDAATGAPLGPPVPLRGFREGPGLVALSPGGRWVARWTSSQPNNVPGRLQTWDTLTGRPAGVQLLEVGSRIVAFRGDEASLSVATWSSGGLVVRTHDLATGREVAPEYLAPTPAGLTHVYLSPQTPGAAMMLLNLMEVPSRQAVREQHLWDLAAGRRREDLVLPPVERSVGLILGPDGRTAILPGPRHVEVWDAKAGRAIGRPIALETVESSRGLVINHLSSDDMIFRADGTMAAVLDGTVVHLVDLRLGVELGPPLRRGVRAVRAAFDPQGRRIATAWADGTVEVADLPTPWAGDSRTALRAWERATGLALDAEGNPQAIPPDDPRIAGPAAESPGGLEGMAFREALACADRDAWRASVECLERHLAARPGDTRAGLWRLRALLELERLEEAGVELARLDTELAADGAFAEALGHAAALVRGYAPARRSAGLRLLDRMVEVTRDEGRLVPVRLARAGVRLRAGDRAGAREDVARSLERADDHAREEIADRYADLLLDPSIVAWTPLEPLEAASAQGARLTAQADRSIVAEGWNPPDETYKVVARMPGPGVTGFRLELVEQNALMSPAYSRASERSAVALGRWEVRPRAGTSGPGPARPIAFTDAHGEAATGEGAAGNAIDDRPATAWTASFSALKVEAVFEAAGPLTESDALLEFRMTFVGSQAPEAIRLWATTAPHPATRLRLRPLLATIGIDAWTRLGGALIADGQPREAIDALSRAPDRLETWLLRGRALAMVGDAEASAAAYGRAAGRIVAGPDLTGLARELLLEDVRLGRLDGRGLGSLQLYALTGVLERTPNDPGALRARAEWYAHHQRWAEAADDQARSIQQPAELATNNGLTAGALRLLSGNLVRYNAGWSNVRGLPEPRTPNAEAHIVRFAVLAPKAPDVAAEVVRIAERLVARSPRTPWILHGHGAALVRAGRMNEGVRQLEASLAAGPWAGDAMNWAMLALAHELRGDPEEARRWSDLADSWIARASEFFARHPGAGAASGSLDVTSHEAFFLTDWLCTLALRREVETLRRDRTFPADPFAQGER